MAFSTDYGPMSSTETTITLPPRIHAQVIRYTYEPMHVAAETAVVWADRTWRYCPMCGEPVSRDSGCPVGADPDTGRLGPYQGAIQHGCGEYIEPMWRECGTDEASIAAAASVLAAERASAVAEQREHITARLRGNLAEILAELAEPIDSEDAADREEFQTTGSDAAPGAYRSDGEWIAWDFDPDDDSEVITVRAGDLA